MKPSEVGARLDGRVDVLLRVSPQTFTSGREISSRASRRDRRAHERRADEDRVGARKLGSRALRPCVDRALGDHDAVLRRARDELELRVAVDVEGRQVARVDADDRRVERHRALQLVGVVRLDERVQPELARVCEQARASSRRRGRAG